MDRQLGRRPPAPHPRGIARVNTCRPAIVSPPAHSDTQCAVLRSGCGARLDSDHPALLTPRAPPVTFASARRTGTPSPRYAEDRWAGSFSVHRPARRDADPRYRRPRWAQGPRHPRGDGGIRTAPGSPPPRTIALVTPHGTAIRGAFSLLDSGRVRANWAAMAVAFRSNSASITPSTRRSPTWARARRAGQAARARQPRAIRILPAARLGRDDPVLVHGARDESAARASSSPRRTTTSTGPLPPLW